MAICVKNLLSSSPSFFFNIIWKYRLKRLPLYPVINNDMEFIDRDSEIKMLQEALNRSDRQFIVIWGRRRIGKSTLIRKVLDFGRGDIYFLADTTSEASQRQLFANIASTTVSGFDGAKPRQLGLFDEDDSYTPQEEAVTSKRDLRALSVATDSIRARFGNDALSYGRDLRFKHTESDTAPMDKRDF